MTGRLPKVTVGEIRRRGSSWRVRWRVEERDLQRTFSTRQQADRFRRRLMDAIDAGSLFDLRTGEPRQRGPPQVPTVAAWARTWLELRVRPGAVLSEPTPGEVLGGAHVSRRSPKLDHVDREMARAVWARLAVRLDGSAAAVTTARRRTLVTKLFDDAVREELLESNPFRRIGRPRRKVASRVDPNRLPTPAGVRKVIEAIESTGACGRRFGAFLTVMLLTGARPEEGHAVELDDITWPDRTGGWGALSLSKVLSPSPRPRTPTAAPPGRPGTSSNGAPPVRSDGCRSHRARRPAGGPPGGVPRRGETSGDH